MGAGQAKSANCPPLPHVISMLCMAGCYIGFHLVYACFHTVRDFSDLFSIQDFPISILLVLGISIVTDRMCTNYTKLNKATLEDHFPLPISNINFG
jgi:hypothetical protein